MANWVKVITSGLTGDKHKNTDAAVRCPYFGCPSNRPFIGSRPTRMKFLGRVQPYVAKYVCKWCGFELLVGMDGERVPDVERPHLVNPNLLHARK